MTEKKYFIGDTIGCTPENQKLALEDFASLGYSVLGIVQNLLAKTLYELQARHQNVKVR